MVVKGGAPGEPGVTGLQSSLCTPAPGLDRGSRKDEGTRESASARKPEFSCSCLLLPLLPHLAPLEPSDFSESPTLITCGLVPCPGQAVQPLPPYLDTACLVQISSSLSTSTSCFASLLAACSSHGLFPTHPSQSQDLFCSIGNSDHMGAPNSWLAV